MDSYTAADGSNRSSLNLLTRKSSHPSAVLSAGTLRR